MSAAWGETEFVTRSHRQRVLAWALLGSDILALVAATQLATYVRFHGLPAIAALERLPGRVSYFQVAWVLAAVWVVALASERLYDVERLFWGTGEFTRIARGLAFGLVAFIMVTFTLKMPGLSRLWIVLAFAMALAFTSLGRLGVRWVLRSVRAKGRLQRRTLVVGANQEARRLIEHLLASPGTGLYPVGCLASSEYEHLSLDYCGDLTPCFGRAKDLVHAIHEHEIDTVLIAVSAFDPTIVARMISEMRGMDISVHLSSGLFEVLTSRLWVREIAGVPLITVNSVSLSRGNLAVKRAFDILVAGLIVLVGAPIWLALALAIVIDSRGPVFYRQTRVGKGGQLFGMYKFRSMCNDAEARLNDLQEHNEATGPLFKIKDDPRVTRVGKWMRRYSVDEFPQLLNVLGGTMSLVGPRPPLEPETLRYTEDDWRRMEVPPGMTGLWQVSGRSELSFEEMVRLDLYYIENWSVGFDIALLFRTVPAVLLAKGAW